ncbi:FHA domain-containing protein [Actinomadura logoneensis]|uniref:FHA domain-containing protein n=1 Tax=Actinomadura logoneensis TaxID=2293572 RepID=A0A372JSG2_9ACTN|nr:FHA domain-containing protein [Actinomadura logoneensis]
MEFAGEDGSVRPSQGAGAGASPGGTARPGGSGGGAAVAAACPVCGTAKSGRFCEVDGYDFATGRQAERPESFTEDYGGHPQPRPKVWTAVVTADRAYYDAVVAQSGTEGQGIAFPPYCPDRRLPLTADRVQIGRRSVSRGIHPEIDLSVPPEDPGVSRLHAVLLAQPDGSWTLVDLGSANGTTLNDDRDPIPVNVPVPVKDGDRVHVGAWTTITLTGPDTLRSAE